MTCKNAIYFDFMPYIQLEHAMCHPLIGGRRYKMVAPGFEDTCSERNERSKRKDISCS